MKKGLPILVAILVIIGGVYLYANDSGLEKSEITKNTPKEQGEGDKSCLKVNTISSNEDVITPSFLVKGTIDNTSSECNWIKFEGQAGLAQLYFEYEDKWQPVGQAQPILVEDWMSDMTDFSVEVGFNNEGIGLDPNEVPIKIVFTEEDPSGMGVDVETSEYIINRL